MDMEMQTAGAGAAAARRDLPKIVVTEDGKRMGLLSEETIRKLQSIRLGPPMHAELCSAEFMRKVGLDEEVIGNMLRAFQAIQALRDIHHDVLQQYNARGYAYLQIHAKDQPHDMDEQIRLLTMQLGGLAT
ncbi:unnamed protein product [Alopecurus aequalis]